MGGDELLQHACRLLAVARTDAEIRRAASAAYYALFHELAGSAAMSMGAGSQEFIATLRRQFEHARMREACEAVLKLGASFRPSVGLSIVASAFVNLQAIRYRADYDLLDTFTSDLAYEAVAEATNATVFWRTVAQNGEGQMFSVLLLLGRLKTRRG